MFRVQPNNVTIHYRFLWKKQHSISNLSRRWDKSANLLAIKNVNKIKQHIQSTFFLSNWWAPPWRNTTSVRKPCSGVTTVYCNTIDHKGHCDTIKWRNYGAMCFLLSGLTLYYQLGKFINLTRNAKDRKCSIVGVGRVCETSTFRKR